MLQLQVLFQTQTKREYSKNIRKVKIERTIVLFLEALFFVLDFYTFYMNLIELKYIDPKNYPFFQGIIIVSKIISTCVVVYIAYWTYFTFKFFLIQKYRYNKRLGK